MPTHRNRSCLLAVGATLCLLGSGCFFDWTGFGYESGHANATPDSGISTANVATLTQAWTANIDSTLDTDPLVYQGVLYAAAKSGVLYAFDATGNTNCSGTPRVCTPLWTAYANHGAVSNTPAIVDGQITVMTEQGYLAAYDAAGVQGCTTGTNGLKTCSPLWSATNPGNAPGSFEVANGLVYTVGAYGSRTLGSITMPGTLAVYDAAGVNGCSGTPKVCTPLWTGSGATYSFSPALDDSHVFAFDANLDLVAYPSDPSSCAGTPAVCAPLWTDTSVGEPGGSPVVVNGIAYVGTQTGAGLAAFDAGGVNGCDADTATCSPLWTDLTGGADYGSPTVYQGRVYIGTSDTTQGGLLVFDAAGKLGCSGTPTTCSPEWMSDPSLGTASYTSVDNGVVFASTSTALAAFDAAGSTDCSGTPVICEPLWSVAGQFRRTIESHGYLYGITVDNVLHAFHASS